MYFEYEPFSVVQDRYEFAPAGKRGIVSMRSYPDGRPDELVRRFDGLIGYVLDPCKEGRLIQFIHTNDDSVSNLAYYDHFSRESYVFGSVGRMYFETNRDLWFGFFMHENGHDRYDHMDEGSQRQLSNRLLGDPNVKRIVTQFGTALYEDKVLLPMAGMSAGEHYLQAHLRANFDLRDLIYPEIVRDTSVLRVPVAGVEHEVMAGSLLQEALCYTSTAFVGCHDVALRLSSERREYFDTRLVEAEKLYAALHQGGHISYLQNVCNIHSIRMFDVRKDVEDSMENILAAFDQYYPVNV